MLEVVVEMVEREQVEGGQMVMEEAVALVDMMVMVDKVVIKQEQLLELVVEEAAVESQVVTLDLVVEEV
tara:strand:- start:237 stop:443 length:207 start_codon:yes stop_codon:yes gene_type:complete